MTIPLEQQRLASVLVVMVVGVLGLLLVVLFIVVVLVRFGGRGDGDNWRFGLRAHGQGRDQDRSGS
jgi:hypothetical protein